MNNIKIISDGTSTGTKVFDSNGQEIKGIKELTIKASPYFGVCASIEFYGVKLELDEINCINSDDVSKNKGND